MFNKLFFGDWYEVCIITKDVAEQGHAVHSGYRVVVTKLVCEYDDITMEP